MFRRAITGAFALILVLTGSLLAPQPAMAGCTGICANVGPPGSFCRRCMDAGFETGVACRDIGNCGCIFVQVDCTGLESPVAAIPSGEEPLLLDQAPLTRIDAGRCASSTGLDPRA
jgi:hypothetical protein